MIWVMALTKAGDNPEQSRWQMTTWESDPRAMGYTVGKVISLDGEPADFKWKVADIFRHGAVS